MAARCGLRRSGVRAQQGEQHHRLDLRSTIQDGDRRRGMSAAAGSDGRDPKGKFIVCPALG
jgi:hypothetical protein